LPAGRGEVLKAAVASGQADACEMVDDAVRTMKRQVTSLKASSKHKPEVAAAADQALQELEAKAKQLRQSVKAGKTVPSHAVEEALVGVAAAAASMKQAGDKAALEVKDFTGGCWAASKALTPGCSTAVAAHEPAMPEQGIGSSCLLHGLQTQRSQASGLRKSHLNPSNDLELLLPSVIGAGDL